MRARPCTGRATSTTSASSVSTPRATCAASTASSACTRRPRTARARRTSRSCAARRPTSSPARAWRAAAMPARRSATSSPTIRATNCSRRARTTSCARRPASCTWASGSDSGCSSGAIRSSAFSSASSTLRARPTRPSCARSGRRSCCAAFNGTNSEFNVHFSESVLARVMITVRTVPGKIPEFDVRALEARLALAARRWDDDLKDALIDALGEARGNELLRRFAGALPAAYREDFSARAAVPDIEMMARLSTANPLGMSLYRPLEAEPGMLRFKLFHLGGPVTLSDSQPMLKRMGLKVLDERPYRISPPDQPPVWLHDFGLQTRPADADVDIDGLHAVFEDAFGRIFRREVENDDFNRLVVAARMPAAEIVVLRAYAKYLRQLGFPLSQAFIESTLVRQRRHHAQSRRAVQGAVRSRTRGRRRCRCRGAPRGRRGSARRRRQPFGGPRAAPAPRADHGDDAHEFLAPRCARAPAHASSRSSSTRRRFPGCPSRGRCSRSSSIHPVSRVST